MLTATAIAENGTAGAVVYTAVATDVDAGTTLTYSLSGADASAFSINSSTGVVTINNANNFEAKSSYSFNVVATDNGGLTATQAVTLATTNVNEAPSITNSSSNPTATSSQAENITSVATYAATDPDAGAVLRFSISGTDAADFTIDSVTGVLAFASNPDSFKRKLGNR